MFLFIEVPYENDRFLDFISQAAKWLRFHNSYDGVICYQFAFNILDRMESANQIIDYCSRFLFDWYIVDKDDCDEEYWAHIQRFSDETVEEYQALEYFWKLFGQESP